jgi:hypothetical protein
MRLCGRIILPIFQYFVWVGAVLLGVLFAIGESDSSPTKSSSAKGWRPTDSLRSMAHHRQPEDPPRAQDAAFRIVK